MQGVTIFNKDIWLLPYIDMKTKLKKNWKNDFEKGFFKLMNNSVFGKAIAARAKSGLASLKAEVGKIDRPKVLIYIS